VHYNTVECGALASLVAGLGRKMWSLQAGGIRTEGSGGGDEMTGVGVAIGAWFVGFAALTLRSSHCVNKQTDKQMNK